MEMGRRLRCNLMIVAMVDVGEVLMGVSNRLVLMFVAMRLFPVPGEVVAMLMVLVVHMTVGVARSEVDMIMPVLFGQMQPDPGPHQQSGDPEQQAGNFG
jgi:hypothetical protein